jgi:hypothetical protein
VKLPDNKRPSVFAVLAFLFFLVSVRAEEVQPLRIAPFKLPDQFQREHAVAFTNAPVRLLTVADQNGADLLPPWIDALKGRFGTNLATLPVADVSAVPRLLRGFIRSKFVERYTYPVLLDFSGQTTRSWQPHPEVPNLYVVSTNGTVLGSFHGLATSNHVFHLLHLLETNGVRTVSAPVP